MHTKVSRPNGGRDARRLPLLLCVLLGSLGAGCGDGDDGSDGNTRHEDPDLGTLEDACDQYCEAAAELGCPDDVEEAQCRTSCVGFPEIFGGCEKEWMALNYCMAEAPLFCERGMAAVRIAECPEAELFDRCLSAL
jgi:hypothetical protein